MKTLYPSRRSVASSRLFRSLVAALLVFASAHLWADTPLAVYPAPNAVLKCPGSSIVLRWSDPSGSSVFFIDVCSDAQMKNHLYQKTVQFDTSISIDILSTQSQYYWTVSTGAETSNPSSFSTLYVKKAELSSLFHGAELSTDLVHFSWKTDDAAVSYVFEYSIGAEQSHDSTVLASSLDLVLPREQTIVWRVRAVCKTANGEWSDRDTLRIAKLTSAVEDCMSETLLLYPQPAAARVRIQCPSFFVDSQTKCELISALGQSTVLPIQWSEGGCTIDVSALPQGAYYLNMCRMGRQSRSSFFIQR